MTQKNLDTSASEQVAVDKYRIGKDSFDLAEKTTKENVCGVCALPLTVKRAKVHTETKAQLWQAACNSDMKHEGFRVVPTVDEAVRSGIAVPVYLANNVQRRLGDIKDVDQMAGVWQDRFSKLSGVGAYQAAMYSMEIGLDPRNNEIACLEFGNSEGGIKTPQVMITAKGWRILAVRHAGNVFLTAPIIMDVLDPVEKNKYGASKDDWVAQSLGRLNGDREDWPDRTELGIFTVSERDGAFGPQKKFPQNQARVRAERKWYERYLPHVIELARMAWQESTSQLDTSKAEELLVSEFSAPRKMSPASQQSSRGSRQ